MDKRRFRHLFWRLAVLALFLALFGADYYYCQRRIYHGVMISGIPLGGLTAEQAARRLEQWLKKEEMPARPLLFQYCGQSWSFDWAELGVKPDISGSVAAAYHTARQGLHVLDYPSRFRLIINRVNLPLAFQVDEGLFYEAMNGLRSELYREPEDARFELSDNNTTVVIVPEKAGRIVDLSRTLEGLIAALASFPEIGTTEIAVEEVEPKITEPVLAKLGIRSLVASASTPVSSAIPNRVHNIRLAAAALDNIIIMSGEEFSFNRVVGSTDAEKGYKKAPVIMNKKLVEGIGGGVCQVSSTLYNTVLLAELSVLERANHSLTVGYLPPGLDATVSYGWRDLRFLNDRPYAVWLRTFFDGARLTVNMYGDPAQSREVRLVVTNQLIIRQGRNFTDTTELPAGEIKLVKEGQPGYRVTVWRVFYQDGVETGREMISSDTYHPVADEYLRGTGED